MKTASNTFMDTIGWPFISGNNPNFNANYELGQVSEEAFLKEVRIRHPNCVELDSNDIFILYTVDDVPVAWYDDENTFGYIEG